MAEKTFNFIVPKPVWRSGPVLDLDATASNATSIAGKSAEEEGGDFDISVWLKYVLQREIEILKERKTTMANEILTLGMCLVTKHRYLVNTVRLSLSR